MNDTNYTMTGETWHDYKPSHRPLTRAQRLWREVETIERSYCVVVDVDLPLAREIWQAGRIIDQYAGTIGDQDTPATVDALLGAFRRRHGETVLQAWWKDAGAELMPWRDLLAALRVEMGYAECTCSERASSVCKVCGEYLHDHSVAE